MQQISITNFILRFLVRNSLIRSFIPWTDALRQFNISTLRIEGLKMIRNVSVTPWKLLSNVLILNFRSSAFVFRNVVVIDFDGKMSCYNGCSMWEMLIPCGYWVDLDRQTFADILDRLRSSFSLRTSYCSSEINPSLTKSFKAQETSLDDTFDWERT